jgi:hypothetical protein
MVLRYAGGRVLVLGESHFSKSKSPGLVKNVLTIIFDKSSVTASLATAAEPSAAPPAKKAKATSRKDRHAAPIAGGHGQAEVQAATPYGATMLVPRIVTRLTLVTH